MLLTFMFVSLSFSIMCSIVFSNAASLFEGDACTNNNINGNSRGRCISVYQCPWAIKQIKSNQSIDRCNFIGNTPIICCPFVEKSNEWSTVGSLKRTESVEPTKRTESVGPIKPTESIVPKGVGGIGQGGKKEDTEPSDLAHLDLAEDFYRSIGIAQMKCDEYYPPPKPGEFGGKGAYGGEDALAKEFPHMAILGYGSEDDKQWKCGGSLISHQHVVTAAHCLNAGDFGNVTFVRLGDQKIKEETDDAQPQDFTVKTIVQHPQFDSKSVKHDIAILELDRPINLTDYVQPACLYLGGELDQYSHITATGWGVTEFEGEPSNLLQKVRLKLVPFDECKKQYARHGVRGQIDDDLQVCAGSASKTELMDTCQGDSGGPLQQKVYGLNQHYKIIGITSFGKACGITNSAGIYTKILSHLSWIVKTVFNS